MPRKVKKYVALASVVVAIAFLISRYTRREYGRSLAMAHTYSTAVLFYLLVEKDSHEFERFRTTPQLESINSANFYREILVAQGYFSSELYLLDEFGNILCLGVDLDSDGEIDLGSNHVTGSVIVWSMGPNGENQYGRGDDVVVIDELPQKL